MIIKPIELSKFLNMFYIHKDWSSRGTRGKIVTLNLNGTLPQSVLKIYTYCTKLLTLEKAGYLKESVTHLLKSRITAWDCPTKETACRINNILQNWGQVIRLSHGIKFDINVETVSDIRQIIHAIWHYFLVCSRHQVQ